jgi:phosphoacetylglucosamine mutase
MVLCQRGAAACGATVEDVGIVTTPQLHHCVRMRNAPPALREAYGGLAGYPRMLREGFVGVLGGLPPRAAERGALVVDCAHGVGALAAATLAAAFEGLVELRLRNVGATPAEAACLNEGVGAEHCQKGRLPPAGFSAPADAGLRCASLDGDADRLVYHSFTAAGRWRLLDGDKIACLCAAFLADLLKAAGLSFTGQPSHAGHHGGGGGGGGGGGSSSEGAGAGGSSDGSAALAPAEALESLLAAPVSVGIVQTAYANGASCNYVSQALGLPVLLAKTGVKFVHAAAAAFDIGVYFEANGHGTVLFHPSFAARLEAAVCGLAPAALEAGLGGGPGAAAALQRLFWCTRLVNQAVGDALSDALFVEAVLCVKGWGVDEWDAVYSDLPSRQAKLPVKDRAAVVTVEDESRLVAPAALQAAIDALVAARRHGRAFVRPSGTEDVVRVYAEADTQEAADALCAEVVKATHALAGGI